jgi:hypothetical protein
LLFVNRQISYNHLPSINILAFFRVLYNCKRKEATKDEIFKKVLDKYLKGTFDPVTLKLLETYDEKEIKTIDDYGYVHKITEAYQKEF